MNNRIKILLACIMSDTDALVKPCPHCGGQIERDAIFCRYCGKSVDASPTSPVSRFCPGCGEPLTGATKFCQKCGRPVTTAGAALASRSALTGVSSSATFNMQEITNFGYEGPEYEWYWGWRLLIPGICFVLLGIVFYIVSAPLGLLFGGLGNIVCVPAACGFFINDFMKRQNTIAVIVVVLVLLLNLMLVAFVLGWAWYVLFLVLVILFTAGIWWYRNRMG
jgi:hypothetical protein